ncbi:acyltransferase family protein [Aureimonas mangrovi]|uniref:acyltransferase family protein n=1 Tax=Aureimonas mangrovi TaxID=2758041 RepID=UPI001AEDCC3C|nr:acyltransferase [Aureimonas mangrovi]
MDELRAFAALLVIFYHGFQLIGAQLAHGTSFDPFSHWVTAGNPLIALIEEGHSGVALFVVLSGFVLANGLFGRDVRYPLFIAARVVRLYPLMLTMTLAAAASLQLSSVDVLSSLLPLPSYQPLPSPFTAMFWAVMVEFQCYLLFPLVLFFINRRGIKPALLLIAAAIMIRFMVVAVSDVSPRDLSYWTMLGRIDQFLIGMCLAFLVSRHDPGMLRGAKLFPLAAVVAFGLLWAFNRAGGWPNDATWKIVWGDVEGLMWAFFIYTFVPFSRRLPRMMKRFVGYVGVISFPLYLVHFAVIGTAMRHGIYVTVSGNGYYDALLTTALVVIPLSLASAALLHYAIEKPFLAFRPRYVAGPAHSPVELATAEARKAG